MDKKPQKGTELLQNLKKYLKNYKGLISFKVRGLKATWRITK